MSFPKLLKSWAEREGIGHPGDAAPRLGCSVATAYFYFNGESLPPATRIPALAEAIGVPESRLRSVIKRDRASRHAKESSSRGGA